ncbi:BMP and activin membrane-bound inhibitor homolog isoform X3 [Venturia canescens]|uniref:BMP and activin membrane-bound inhibitor homolog isoform X3 n=1 Tax=Venturia canescens TaxID=32260 RepID=UPI001C9D3D53|nr:BMP and activin membrane-bound inhibitor homolog isoform X3 [Venturia canescens]
MWPRELIAFATITTTLFFRLINAASVGLDLGDYEILNQVDEKPESEGARHSDSVAGVGEVRCYCNQPECVPQGYMCRGKGCFTELPLGSNSPSFLRPEHSANNGCLEESFKEKQCPPGFLCCEQDLCNHVDSPAMINRLNKTLQVLVGDQRAFLGPIQPTGPATRATDGWFKTATIAVPICGLVVLLILASLAIRLLQPLPSQGDKLGPHRTLDNAPPLLGPPKVPLV